MRIARLVACTIILARAQMPVWTKYLLPDPVSLSGTVVGQDGDPISEVSIDHAEGNRFLKTDEEGRFRFQTRAPALVFRKNGFDPNYYRVGNGTDIRITLKRSGRSLPACRSNAQCTTLQGWGSTFCFPKVPNVSPLEQGADIDYGYRWFAIGKPDSRRGMRHGAGPMWSFGSPLDGDVWASVEYSEVDYVGAILPMIDARGKTGDGKLWRSLGTFGESASYSDLNSEDAALLDKLLDGVCLEQR